MNESKSELNSTRMGELPEGKLSITEAFADTFIPFNMAGNRAYEELQKNGRFPNEEAKKALIRY